MSAAVSIDLDDLWTYRQSRGEPDCDDSPSFLPLVIPRILNLLKGLEIKATFFVVGRDACAPLLAPVAAAGHEIGNHSYQHQPWMHLHSEAEIEEDISRAEEAILAACGLKPVGFRGPGHSRSPVMHRILASRGYLYDASPWPTWVMPLARLAWLQGRSSPPLGPGFDAVFRSLNLKRLPEGIVEIPVTTFPILRTPLHHTYLHLLPPPLALFYFRAGLKLARATGIQPCLLLHATDFLGREDRTGPAGIPGMSRPLEAKLNLVKRTLDETRKQFPVTTLKAQAESFRPQSPNS